MQEIQFPVATSVIEYWCHQVVVVVVVVVMVVRGEACVCGGWMEGRSEHERGVSYL